MIALPLGPAPTNQDDEKNRLREEDKDKEGNNDEYDHLNEKKEGYKFQDEVIVDGKNLFTIDHENILDNEDKPKRKSRWGPKPQRKNKVHKDIVFNPFEFLQNQQKKALLGEGQVFGQIQKTEEKKENKSKWGHIQEKTFHPPLLNYIPTDLNQDDLEFILRCYRLDEMNNQEQYKTETILDDEDCRPPSPEPEYDNHGKRTNTREQRDRQAFLKEKQSLIEECMKIDPSFVPPRDYKPAKKFAKVFLPDDVQDQQNYIGKIIGKEGANQKRMEKESGSKISIRGKGSSMVKKNQEGADEKLHVYIQADTDESVEKGKILVEQCLGEEDHKYKQLSVVAIANNYLSDDYCRNCHEKGHKDWQCPLILNKTIIKCGYCQERSHVTQDCPQKEYFEELKRKEEETKLQEKIQEEEFEKFIRETEGDNAEKIIQMKRQEKQSEELKQKNKQRIETAFLTDEVTDTQLRQITQHENQSTLFGQDPYKQQQTESASGLPPIPQPRAGQTYAADKVVLPGLPKLPGQEDQSNPYNESTKNQFNYSRR